MDLELILAPPVSKRVLGLLPTLLQKCTLLVCVQYISISRCRRKTTTLHANLCAQNMLHNDRLYFRKAFNDSRLYYRQLRTNTNFLRKFMLCHVHGNFRLFFSYQNSHIKNKKNSKLSLFLIILFVSVLYNTRKHHPARFAL